MPSAHCFPSTHLFVNLKCHLCIVEQLLALTPPSAPQSNHLKKHRCESATSGTWTAAWRRFQVLWNLWSFHHCSWEKAGVIPCWHRILRSLWEESKFYTAPPLLTFRLSGYRYHRSILILLLMMVDIHLLCINSRSPHMFSTYATSCALQDNIFQTSKAWLAVVKA